MMASTQMKDRAGSATAFTLPEAAQVAGWQVQAIEEYEYSWAAALARTQEDAAIEAQDVLSQADEALVMG